MARLPQAWIEKIFQKFQINYGHIWTSRHTSERAWMDAEDEWATELGKMQPEEIRRALENLPSMPPSIPAFKALGKEPVEEQKTHHAAYRFFKPAPQLEKQRDPDKAAAAEKAREEIRRMCGIKR